MIYQKKSQGFTLIEILLAVSVIAILLTTLSVFLSLILESRIKQETMAEVEGQGMQAMQYITQTIRNAEGIISPVTSTASSSVSLDVVTSALDSTMFALSQGTLYSIEGTTSTPLTSARVVVDALTFTNLSATGSPGSLRIQFTVRHATQSGRQEFIYEKTFISAATLR